ncbi:MAG TPA: COR domain-containing protein [Pyrinomonadaceae bacterium]|jgi:internalin A|nr:COR domain-containing protein [Pyrinomonadaceae bacterium]
MLKKSPIKIQASKKQQTPEEIAEERIAKWRPKKGKRWETHEAGWGVRVTWSALDLKALGLKRVPESLRRVSDIEVLDLAENEIHELPKWIGELKTLKGINLGGNRLRTLPIEIGLLRDLRFLLLQRNRLETLPEALRRTPLDYLVLDGNPKLRLPDSLLRIHNAEEILRYYFESRGEKGGPLLELKLLLVGRGRAGKTTLVKRLAGEDPDAHESETHSISIRELMLYCNNRQVRSRAWDFGGQEILHATHQFFLTERSLYLLVLEPRTGLAQRDAEYWLKLIETQGNGSPVIVAMNWSHGRPWKVDEVKLHRKFPFIVGFIPTDALYGDGIERLRRKINETVEKRMPDVWLPFPKRWRKIKDEVSGMRDNFLTYRRYVNLCKRSGEKRPAAQSDLAGILHALGLALYFGNDPRLHDTRVLNPGWVTGGVYAVIRSQSVAKNDGQLAVADMPQVLREAEEKNVIKVSDYPPKTHGFILDLMRAFQLCYASEEEEGKPTRYLVPELLSEFEPRMEERWERAPVRLRYRYEVLPPGFLPRFIVRTHALSEDAPHWRHGVVLRHATAAALIRAETDRPELHVFILGGSEERRGVLVAMVRRELESLHDELKIQSVEELELTGESEQWISVRSLREVEKPGVATQKLPVQPEGTAEVNVARELNKLLPASARAIDRAPETAPTPVRVFVSYAHDDERQLKRLDAILDVLEQQHGLTSWLDKRLIAGSEWDEEIRRRLEEMDIFLFIASQTSLVRPYIRDPELRRARERHAKHEVEVVTVKLEPCACDDDPFLGGLQRLASQFQSIAQAKLKSTAWDQVRKDLLPVIKRVRQRKDGMKG